MKTAGLAEQRFHDLHHPGNTLTEQVVQRSTETRPVLQQRGVPVTHALRIDVGVGTARQTSITALMHVSRTAMSCDSPSSGSTSGVHY